MITAWVTFIVRSLTRWNEAPAIAPVMTQQGLEAPGNTARSSHLVNQELVDSPVFPAAASAIGAGGGLVRADDRDRSRTDFCGLSCGSFRVGTSCPAGQGWNNRDGWPLISRVTRDSNRHLSIGGRREN
jgi:hypothetical protein